MGDAGVALTGAKWTCVDPSGPYLRHFINCGLGKDAAPGLETFLDLYDRASCRARGVGHQALGFLGEREPGCRIVHRRDVDPHVVGGATRRCFGQER